MWWLWLVLLVLYIIFAFPIVGLILLLLCFLLVLPDIISSIRSSIYESKSLRNESHKKFYQNDMQQFYENNIKNCEIVDALLDVDVKCIHTQDNLVGLLDRCSEQKIQNLYHRVLIKQNADMIIKVKKKIKELDFPFSVCDKSAVKTKKRLQEIKQEWETAQADLDKYSYEHIKKLYYETEGVTGEEVKKQKMRALLPVVAISVCILGILVFFVPRGIRYHSRYQDLCNSIASAINQYGNNAVLIIKNNKSEVKEYDLNSFWDSYEAKISFEGYNEKKLLKSMMSYMYGYSESWSDSTIIMYILAGVMIVPLIVYFKRWVEW